MLIDEGERLLRALDQLALAPRAGICRLRGELPVDQHPDRVEDALDGQLITFLAAGIVLLHLGDELLDGRMCRAAAGEDAGGKGLRVQNRRDVFFVDDAIFIAGDENGVEVEYDKDTIRARVNRAGVEHIAVDKDTVALFQRVSHLVHMILHLAVRDVGDLDFGMPVAVEAAKRIVGHDDVQQIDREAKAAVRVALKHILIDDNFAIHTLPPSDANIVMKTGKMVIARAAPVVYHDTISKSNEEVLSSSPRRSTSAPMNTAAVSRTAAASSPRRLPSAAPRSARSSRSSSASAPTNS